MISFAVSKFLANNVIDRRSFRHRTPGEKRSRQAATFRLHVVLLPGSPRSSFPAAGGRRSIDQKTRGRFLGGSRPFGWQIAADGSLEPLESEHKALAMRRMQKAGKSLRAVATAMQERGFAISHQSVKNALTRVARPCDP
jgi:hypothetical protein